MSGEESREEKRGTYIYYIKIKIRFSDLVKVSES